MYRDSGAENRAANARLWITPGAWLIRIQPAAASAAAPPAHRRNGRRRSGNRFRRRPESRSSSSFRSASSGKAGRRCRPHPFPRSCDSRRMRRRGRARSARADSRRAPTRRGAVPRRRRERRPNQADVSWNETCVFGRSTNGARRRFSARPCGEGAAVSEPDRPGRRWIPRAAALPHRRRAPAAGHGGRP